MLRERVSDVLAHRCIHPSASRAGTPPTRVDRSRPDRAETILLVAVSPPTLSSLERELTIYKGLVEVSAIINGITDKTELLPAVLDVARRVLGVEAASLFLVNPAGNLQLAAATGAGTGGLFNIEVPRGKGIAGWVLEHGQPLLVADTYADPRFFQEVDRQTGFRTRSMLCVPLVREGREIGVLQMINPIGRLAFESTDLEAFAAYGTLAATAIDKLRIMDARRDNEQREQEYAFCREIQTSFLPRELPDADGLSFASIYRPAQNVGGDFFDVVSTAPGEFHFVVGDVAGKGMPAALLMAQAVSSFRMLLTPGMAPQAAVSAWNRQLYGRTVRGMFITAVVGRVIAAERRVELANAGHCPPFCGNGARIPEEWVIPGTPPLGILPELACRQSARDMAPGDWLAFFTDGLVECLDESGIPLDRSGVLRLLTGPYSRVIDVVDALDAGEQNHRRRAVTHDDLTVLAFGFSQ